MFLKNQSIHALQQQIRRKFPDWRVVLKRRKLYLKKSQGMNAWISQCSFSLDTSDELLAFLYTCHKIEQDLVYIRDSLDLCCHLVFTYGRNVEQPHSYFPLFKHICINVEDLCNRFPTKDEWRSVLLHEIGHYLDHRAHHFLCFSGSSSLQEEKVAWEWAESLISTCQITPDVFHRIKTQSLQTYLR